MNRQGLLIAMLATFAAIVAFLTYLIVDRAMQQRELQARSGFLPIKAGLFALDGGRFTIPTGKPVVLILFNSTCEHCQYELSQINAEINSFNNIELVFLSSEPIPAIKQSALPFEGNRNVNFVKINPEDVFDNFGTVRYPTILIYGTNGRLIKEFKGETKVEAILKYARQ